MGPALYIVIFVSILLSFFLLFVIIFYLFIYFHLFLWRFDVSFQSALQYLCVNLSFSYPVHNLFFHIHPSVRCHQHNSSRHSLLVDHRTTSFWCAILYRTSRYSCSTQTICPSAHQPELSERNMVNKVITAYRCRRLPVISQTFSSVPTITFFM